MIDTLNKDNGLSISAMKDVKMRSAMEDIQYVILQVENVRDEIIFPEIEYLVNSSDTIVEMASSSYEKYLKERTDEISKVYSYTTCTNDKQLHFEYYANILGIRTAYTERLAIKASKFIYNKLEPAIIDLRKEDAKEGDVLRIYVNRYNSEGEISIGSDSNQTAANKKEILIAAYDIKEIGFRLKIADSFLLVKRSEESTDETDTSPSRFKGAPGVTMMWSYGSDAGKGKLWKWWEPSLGINVSYLDFSTSKDIEVGVGFVLGLFRNQLFIVGGRNLNIEQNSTYFGLGFSFSNLAAKFVDSKE